PKLNHWKATRQIPATTPESVAFSKDLKHRGFSFVGPTVVYAYMQAVGMVNDHLVDCFRYRQIASRRRRSGGRRRHLAPPLLDRWIDEAEHSRRTILPDPGVHHPAR